MIRVLYFPPDLCTYCPAQRQAEQLPVWNQTVGSKRRAKDGVQIGKGSKRYLAKLLTYMTFNLVKNCQLVFN